MIINQIVDGELERGRFPIVRPVDSFAKTDGCDRILSAMPPLSSGPGRGPLKAKTRIRIPLGAPLTPNSPFPASFSIFTLNPAVNGGASHPSKVYEAKTMTPQVGFIRIPLGA